MSASTAEIPGQSGAAKTKPRHIPDFLVRESFGGTRYFYPGFRAVWNKTKTLDDVMADSTLQWILKEQIGDLVKALLDASKYRLGRGEVGIHLGPNENMGLDIAIFDRQLLTTEKKRMKYADVPPLAVVEIDVAVELPEKNAHLFEEYVLPKIQRLIEFGVRRVVWVFSKSRRVFIADAGRDWYFVSWDRDVELMPGISFNVQKILKSEGML
ncbi:MAG: hypothetical protein DYG98_19065 [Haliscomenobacteraceae bacterium CHB4]|nr:hypothetical protein [Saprospiraceae bacterium]MCE7925160.1 hypothetical protein [Haliscomenobacteraceae bacterium CHB4]